MKKLLALALVACAALAAAAAAQTATARADATTSLTIYSGREERLVSRSSTASPRKPGSRSMYATARARRWRRRSSRKGKNSRADVFFAQEAGLLGFVARESLLEVLPQQTLNRVPARFRAPGKRWVGTSGARSRDRLQHQRADDGPTPEAIWDLTKPQWKGKVGLRRRMHPSRRSSR